MAVSGFGKIVHGLLEVYRAGRSRSPTGVANAVLETSIAVDEVRARGAPVSLNAFSKKAISRFAQTFPAEVRSRYTDPDGAEGHLTILLQSIPSNRLYEQVVALDKAQFTDFLAGQPKAIDGLNEDSIQYLRDLIGLSHSIIADFVQSPDRFPAAATGVIRSQGRALRSQGKRIAGLEALSSGSSLDSDGHMDAHRYFMSRIPRDTRDVLLDYQSEAVKFVGRDAEIGAIIDFCLDNPAPFRWQAITGHGGAGKSRLAWEACRLLRAKGWQAEFLERDFFEGPDRAIIDWSLSGDVLLVVDYVAFRAHVIGSWLMSLAHARTATKVRVLLLERAGWNMSEPGGTSTAMLNNAPPLWYRELAQSWSSADLRVTCGDLGRFAPVIDLDRTRLSSEDQMSILVGISVDGRSIPSEIAAIMVERLVNDIDPEQCRPLYLLFLASAFLERPDDSAWRSWNANQLQEIIYDREISRLRAVMPETWHWAADLWTLSTASHSPIINVLDGRRPGLLMPGALEPGDTETLREQLHQTCGGGSYDVTPYQPDVPGEYFVLARLKQKHARGGDDGIARFAQQAWSQSPGGFADFLGRVCADYSLGTHQANIIDPVELFVPPEKSEFAAEYGRALALTTVAGSSPLNVRGLLSGLSEKYPNDRSILTYRAAALFNLAAASGSYHDKRDLIEELGELREDYPDGHDVLDPPLAMGFALLGAAAPTVDVGREHLQQLRELVVGNATQSQDLVNPLAMAISNMMGVSPSLREKKRLLGELRSLASGDQSEQRALDLPLAMGLVNLIAAVRLPDEKRTLLGELRVVADANPGQSEIEARLAMGLVNVMTAEGRATEYRGFLRELRHLMEQNSDDPAFEQFHIEGIRNAFVAVTGRTSGKGGRTMLDVVSGDGGGMPTVSDIEMATSWAAISSQWRTAAVLSDVPQGLRPSSSLSPEERGNVRRRHRQATLLSTTIENGHELPRSASDASNQPRQ